MRCICFRIATVLLLAAGTAALAPCQITRIMLAAGTPEDQALQQISNEPDAGKRIAALRSFLQQFAGNTDAVAFANWQLAQNLAAANDMQQALVYGEKAAAAEPRNLEILLTLASIAAQSKDNERAIRYATRGGEVYNHPGTKPAGMTDERFAAEIAGERQDNVPTYEGLQDVAYSVVVNEANPKKRLDLIQRFNGAFPDTKYQDQISEFAILTLSNLNDTETAIAYGEAVLQQNPNNLPTLVMLANTYIESPKNDNLSKGMEYAQRAIGLAKADEATADPQRKLSGGLAHGELGYALMRQGKTAAAIPELQRAAPLVKGNATASSAVLYRLGNAYSLLRRYDEAKEILREAADIAGPFQQQSKDLLSKLNAVRNR
jgi:tetratricopeptide (TPR) repeat protein